MIYWLRERSNTTEREERTGERRGLEKRGKERKRMDVNLGEDERQGTGE